ncbi:hypothetical protein KA107_00635 [Candidatus Pacearchaeota archaeon]|nr:hypothetical protein [Candidatus Pacearchaeota archaeon]
MTNSRSVANIMKSHAHASARRVGVSYQLGQLEGNCTPISESLPINIVPSNHDAFFARYIRGEYSPCGEKIGPLIDMVGKDDYFEADVNLPVLRIFGLHVLSDDSTFGGTDSNYAGTQVITPETNERECPNQIDCMDMGASSDCARNPADCDVARHVAYLTGPVFKKTPVRKPEDKKYNAGPYDGGRE